jgi:C4-type Zn-finger protein
VNSLTSLSQTRFVRAAGMSCPVCHSSAIEFENPEPVHGAATKMETVCADCNARWFIEARVIGYQLIDPGSVTTAYQRRQECRAKRRRTHVYFCLAA